MLEQGFQRAGDDEKLLAFGPVVADLMALGRRTRRIHRLPVTFAPRSARNTGRRRWCGSRSSRRRPLAAGAGAGAGRRRGGELPRCPADRRPVPGQRAAAVRRRAASSPVSIVEIAGETGGFRRRRPGDRNRDVRRVRRRGRGGAGGSGAASPTVSTTAPRRRSEWPTAPRTTRCVRRRGSAPGDDVIVLGRRRRRRAGRRHSSAARSAPTSPPSRPRPKSWPRQPITAPRHVDRPPPGDLRAGAARRAARRRGTPSSTRSAGELSEPALRSLRRGGRFVTVGLRVGRRSRASR